MQIARRLKLASIPEFSHMSGGQAIERAATKATDPKKFEFPTFVTRKRDCQFSFAGLWSNCLSYIANQEKELKIDANKVIPDVYDLCASLQWSIAKHICLRTQRAMDFVVKTNLIPQERVVAVTMQYLLFEWR